VYAAAERDDNDLLGKLKAAGMQVNTPNKDAFVKASQPVYEEFAKEVPGSKEIIDRALALGK
jgi:TRAP-type C4-dicarboxylate transport system substrate-binding protein